MATTSTSDAAIAAMAGFVSPCNSGWPTGAPSQSAATDAKKESAIYSHILEKKSGFGQLELDWKINLLLPYGGRVF
jgi:hypothetical protein